METPLPFDIVNTDIYNHTTKVKGAVRKLNLNAQVILYYDKIET